MPTRTTVPGRAASSSFLGQPVNPCRENLRRTPRSWWSGRMRRSAHLAAAPVAAYALPVDLDLRGVRLDQEVPARWA
jgi:hypothetical protein